MDSEERQRLINRISSGILHTKVQCNAEQVSVIFHDPSLELVVEGDSVYQNTIETSEGLTLEESFKHLESQGKWSDEMEKKVVVLEGSIRRLRLQLWGSLLHKTRQANIKKEIESLSKEYSDTYRQKYSMWTSTKEYLAEHTRRKYIIRRISSGFPDILYENFDFLDNLIVCYYERNAISETVLRELARTEPWRTYWAISKKTGTSLLKKSAVEMTEQQSSLLRWSNIYDWANESMDSPTDDIIEDDMMFDAWLLYQSDKIKNETHAKIYGSNMPNTMGRQEVFIPTDAAGAKDVYAMNDPVTRSKIKKRQKFIEAKGVAKEIELPDVRLDLQMARNKATMERAKGNG